jgi:flagellar motor switch protein FliG
MAVQTGEGMAISLLRILPNDLAEQLLGRLDKTVSDRLRTSLSSQTTQPTSEELDGALTEFFDLMRISHRGPVRSGNASETEPVQLTPVPSPSVEAQSPPPDPIIELRGLSTDKLLKVLDGEPPAVTALLLTVLDQPVASALLKGLPNEKRAAVAVRFSQPGNRNYTLVQQLARAVVDKGRRLAEQPSETPPDTRIVELAAMLRGLPREERKTLFASMAESDAALTDRVKEKLFRFEDVLKIDDRAVQGILAQLNLKVIAIALKGADEGVSTKVTNNISSRARELLQEEIGLLGSVSAEQLEEAQKEIVALIRQGDEDGKFTISE